MDPPSVSGMIVGMNSVLRRPPRGGPEATQFSELISLLDNVLLTDHADTWKWSPNLSYGFSVSSARCLIDSHVLDVSPTRTRWNRILPIKVNIFLWKLLLNKLPSRFNLDKRGIDIHSILCPIFQEDVETVNHIFFSCSMASDLWARLASWWELDFPLCANLSDWNSWIDTSPLSSKTRVILEVVGGTLLWHIWTYRNKLIFSSSPPKKAWIWDSVVSQSFMWINARNVNYNSSWLGWLQNPIATITSM